MIDIKISPLLGLCILLTVNLSALSATQSTVSLELGADDDDGKNYYLSGRHKFENGIQIKAGTGGSRTKDPFDDELESSIKHIGIQSDPVSLFSLGFEKNHSLQVDTFEVDSNIITLAMNTDDWHISVSPLFRNISVATVRFQRSFDFESDGVAAGAAYYGWDPFYLSFNRATYDYPDKIAVVNNRINLFTYIFGSSTIDQVFALEDKRSTFELGYFFNKASIALSLSEGQSTLDNSISTINTIYFSYNASYNWTIGAAAGTSKIDITNTTTRFGSISLSYRW